MCSWNSVFRVDRSPDALVLEVAIATMVCCPAWAKTSPVPAIRMQEAVTAASNEVKVRVIGSLLSRSWLSVDADLAAHRLVPLAEVRIDASLCELDRAAGLLAIEVEAEAS